MQYVQSVQGKSKALYYFAAPPLSARFYSVGQVQSASLDASQQSKNAPDGTVLIAVPRSIEETIQNQSLIPAHPIFADRKYELFMLRDSMRR